MGQPTPRQSQIEAQIKQYKETNNEHDQIEQLKQQAFVSTSTSSQQVIKKTLSR